MRNPGVTRPFDLTLAIAEENAAYLAQLPPDRRRHLKRMEEDRRQEALLAPFLETEQTTQPVLFADIPRRGEAVLRRRARIDEVLSPGEWSILLKLIKASTRYLWDPVAGLAGPWVPKERIGALDDRYAWTMLRRKTGALIESRSGRGARGVRLTQRLHVQVAGSL